MTLGQSKTEGSVRYLTETEGPENPLLPEFAAVVDRMRKAVNGI
jgi:hypothetical protein